MQSIHAVTTSAAAEHRPAITWLHDVVIETEISFGLNVRTSSERGGQSAELALLRYLCFLNGHRNACIYDITSMADDAEPPNGQPTSVTPIQAEHKSETAAGRTHKPRPAKYAKPFYILEPGDYDVRYLDHDVHVTYTVQPKPYRSIINGRLRLRFEPPVSEEQLCQLLATAQDFAFPPRDKDVPIQMLSDDDWEEVATCPPRDMSTVYLPSQLKQDVMDDLARFLSRKARYTALGVPYKRIYMFAGRSGTGKTSFIYALASRHGFGIAVLHLTSKMDDASLTEALLRLETKNHVLVIEDIDCLFRERRKHDVSTNVTFSGLLNVLDGVARYSSLIVFLTTNHLEALDDALIRPGRVDRIVLFDYATEEQVRAMFTTMLPEQVSRLEAFMKKLNVRGLTTATLQKFFLDQADCTDIVAELPKLYELRDSFEKYKSVSRSLYA